MQLPNPTDLGTFQKQSAENNARWTAEKQKRDRQYMLMVAAPIIISGMLAFTWVERMVLPAWERVAAANQENVHVVRR